MGYGGRQPRPEYADTARGGDSPKKFKVIF